MTLKLTLLATVLCLPSWLASAQQAEHNDHQWVNQSEGEVPSAATLQVKVEGGSIRLEGHSGDQISYLVRRSASAQALNRTTPENPLFKIATYVRGTTSWLVARPQNDESSLSTMELLVRVPRKIQYVELYTSGGDVSVHGVSSRLKVVSGGGHLQMDDVDGIVSAETGGQDIDVGTIGNDGRFHTGGGNISIATIKGNVDAFTGGGGISLGTGMRNAVLESGAGDVHVTFCGGQLKAQSGGGNLVLGDVEGPVDIRTSGGNLRLHSAKGFVHAHTTAGSIELEDVPSADATAEVGSIMAKFKATNRREPTSSLETSIGDITVFLPPDLHVTVRARVDLGAGHSISSEVPGIRVQQDSDAGNVSVFAQGELNGGGPVLRVHTANGNISFRRLER
jgi:DUF4097 and DUF4098 domain-containing protein YvlB